MAELSVIAKEICKNKNLDKNLSAYINNMMTCYSRFSYIKFSMNYYTFCDVLRDSGEAQEQKEALRVLNGMIEENIVNNAEEDGKAGEEARQNALKRLMELRGSVMDTMEIVTAYVDRFLVLEHVLNRVEFRFSEETLDEDYY
ncbi:MAG: hypothetical protein NC086_07535, partial [Alistipes sp.]|nr:hypothetical protein [Alistipes sp.]